MKRKNGALFVENTLSSGGERGGEGGEGTGREEGAEGPILGLSRADLGALVARAGRATPNFIGILSPLELPK